jgi:hypothetical protein
MRITALAILWAGVATLALADKKPVIAESNAGNESLEITASMVLEKEEMLQLVGVELPPGVVVAKVRVRLLSEEPVRIDIDDFTLLSHKDGQRSGPFSPTQLAGTTAIKIKMQQAGGGGGMAGQPSRRPTWGGIPGTMGGPMGGGPMPGDGGMIGNTSSTGPVAGGVEATGDSQAKESPLLTALKEKTLPSAEIKESVSGLLFFPLEGKHKAKDLSMVYKGHSGRLVISFGR